VNSPPVSMLGLGHVGGELGQAIGRQALEI
jgi:hypothetical protein